MSVKTSLMLVDDHVLMRESLANALAAEQDMEILATASNADEAYDKAIRLAPDVLLMDIDMPGRLCFEVARQITARCPQIRIIFLSAFFNDRFVQHALEIEAHGYVTKSEPLPVLLAAIRDVAAGGVHFSKDVQDRIVVLSGGAQLVGQRQSRISTLTNRELEVLQLLARGMTNKDIAQSLYVSSRTVDNHVAHLMSKLSIHTRVELARFAIREGLAAP